MDALLIAIALVLAGMRVAGFHDQSYQAAAHLFLGWLIGAGYFQNKSAPKGSWNAPVSSPEGNSAGLKFFLVVLLTVVEVSCFVWFKFFA